MKNKGTGIFKNTVLVVAVVLASKCLGLLRETFVAALYGATAETDAFFFAQSMPGTIFPSVCNGISTAFVSLYVMRLTEKGEEDADRYASRTLLFALFLGIILSAVGAMLSSILVPLLAPGFSGDQRLLAIELTQLTMGSFFLFMLQYMLTAILNSKSFFVGSQIAALFYSGTIAVVLLVVGSGKSMEWLTLLTIFANLSQLIALVFCCWGHFHFSPIQKPAWQENRQLLHLTIPILLGNSVVQIHTIVDKALGSLLPDGSLSALSYGNTLGNLVVNVLVVSLTTVLYPNLTREAVEGDSGNYGRILTKSMSGLTALMIPITCVTLLCAKDVVEIVYGRGSFDLSAVENTSLVLVCYAPMFVFCAVREVLTRAYFAVQDTKTPMINSAISVSCNVVLSLALTPWLGIVGITLGTSISTLLTALLLLRSIRRKLPQLRMTTFYENIRNQLLAGVGAEGILWMFLRMIPIHSPVLRFGMATIICFGIYLLFLLLITKYKVFFHRK